MMIIQAFQAWFERIEAVRAPLMGPFMVRFYALIWRVPQAQQRSVLPWHDTFRHASALGNAIGRVTQPAQSVAWRVPRPCREDTAARAAATHSWRGAPAISLYRFGAGEDCDARLAPALPPRSVRPHQSDTRKRHTRTWLNAIYLRARHAFSGRHRAHHVKGAFVPTRPLGMSSKWRSEVQCQCAALARRGSTRAAPIQWRTA